MAKKNYDEMSRQILDLVGGSENVVQFAHCVTRLRFTVKDKSIVKADEVNKVNGVIGTQWLGEQFQVIVGTEVENIYDTICKVGHLKAEAAIEENLDSNLSKKRDFSLRGIGNKILAYLTPAMT